LRILVTRPEADAKPLAKRLKAMGMEVILEPLLFIEYLDGPELNLSGVQALLATSANGVRALARRCRGRACPVYAVGDASARAAREAGFTKIVCASGDVEALAQTAAARLDPKSGSLVHAAGTKLAGDLKGLLEAQGFDYRRYVLYQAKKAENFSGATLKALAEANIDGVLLFSPRTGRAFVELLKKAELEAACRSAVAYCLSPAVAAEIKGVQWRQVRVAARPDQDSLLKTLNN